jgi:ribosomal protein S17E
MQESSLGLPPELAKQYEEQKMNQMANEIVNKLDSLQEKGAPVNELTNIYNNLDPDIKLRVKKIKENKKLKENYIRKQSKRLQNKLPGTSTQRINSPITKSAQQILMDTLKLSGN